MEHQPEITREIVDALRELAIYHLAHARTLHALLASLDPDTQRSALDHLASQAATAVPPGLESASLSLAKLMASAAIEGSPPPTPDQLLQLVRTGKDRE